MGLARVQMLLNVDGDVDHATDSFARDTIVIVKVVNVVYENYVLLARG
jgi:hypothetical protein